jgi:hypothetical protein
MLSRKNEEKNNSEINNTEKHEKQEKKDDLTRVKSVSKFNSKNNNIQKESREVRNQREKSSNKLTKEKSVIKTNGSNNDNKNLSKDVSMQLASKNLIENSFTKFANKKLQEKDWEFNKKSNKKTIKNAINNVCLAGNTNFTCRTKIIEVMDNCSCENYLILFKDNMGRKVRNNINTNNNFFKLLLFVLKIKIRI